MTLNGVMALILRYFTELGSFGAHHVKVVVDVSILSAIKIQSKESGFSNI